MSSNLAAGNRLSLVLLAGLAGLAAGCGASPLQMVREGRLSDALYAVDEADGPTRQSVFRAILEEEAPAFTLEVVEDEELARLVGAHTARALSPAWVLLRLKLTTRGRVLPYPTFAFELGRDGLEIPSFSMKQTEGLLAATGERAAEGHTYSNYKSRLCDEIGLLCLALGPVALLTIEKSGSSYSPPSEEDHRRAAPTATRIAEALAGQCDKPGVCMRFSLLRRPHREDEQISLRVRVSLSRTHEAVLGNSDDLDAYVTAPIPPGPTLAARLPLSLSLSRRAGVELVRREARSIRFCSTWKAEHLMKGEGSCLVPLVPLKAGATSSFGLALPPPPASLTTPAESAAKRPWWIANDTSAPPGAAPKTASQDAAADTELAVCTFDKAGLYRGWARFGAPPGDLWARVADRTALLPLVHVAPGGALDVKVWDDDNGKRRLAGSATLERRGASLVAKKIRTARGQDFPLEHVTCTPYDRAAVEAAIVAAWPAAVDAIDLAAEDAASFEVDLEWDGFGFPSPRFEAARAAITKMAALVGWSDPRALALLAREAAADAAAGQRIKAALTAFAADKKDVKIRGGLQDHPDYALRVVGVRCGGAEAEPCGLEVEITPDKQSGGGVRGLSLQIVMDDGHFAPARLPENLSIEGGEARKVLVKLDRGARLPPGVRPWALVHNQFFSHWLHFPP